MTVRCRLSLTVCLLLPSWVVADDRPNFVLVVTDDQGYWDTGVSGNPDIRTPTMDRLAAEGVQFTRFYVAPVCAPTRAGLMTGRHYLRTGLYNTRFGGDTLGRTERTMAQLLQQAGYRTGLFGKWHLGKYAGYQPQQRGFDEFLGHYHGHIEHYESAEQLVHNGERVTSRGYVTDLFTEAAIDFIRRDVDAPFLCVLAFNAPHSPHVLDTNHYGQPKGDKLLAEYLARGLPLRDARIYAMVERIDQNLARLTQAIDDRGLAENTVVMFMSDNGGVSRHFKAGLRGNKAQVYEGGVRSPLFVRWPGKFPAGGRVDAQTSYIDVLPTLCELAGVRVPEDRVTDGRSLVPLLRAGKGSEHHKYVYHTWDRYQPNADRRWAISSQRYKLLCNLPTNAKPDRKKWQLFDLQSDPAEKTNVAGKHPEIVRDLRQRFQTWFSDVTAGQRYQPIAIPVGHPDENPVELQPSWATWVGDTIQYTFEGYDWDTIDSWSKPGEHAIWNLNLQQGGAYEVRVRYGCAAADAGGKLRISVGEQPLEYEPTATPTADVFVERSVGTIRLIAGPAQLRAEAVEVPGSELMSLNAILLRRIER